MATVEVKCLDEYALMLSRLENESEGIIKRAVYAGAGVVADAIKTEIKALPVSNAHGSPEHPVDGITAKQKADLIEGFGLSGMEYKDGFVQVKAGFDGYGSVRTKKYPKGLPNVLLARSLNSGTSFRKKNPFVRRAVNKSRKAAQEAMGKQVDEEIKKISKE